MKSFKQFREEISIMDMAMSVGYKYDRRKGKKWPVFVNGNKEKIMIVNPKSSSNQGYRNLHDDTDKGTLIDFVSNRLGNDFPVDASLSEAMNVNKVLYNFTKEVFPENQIYWPNEKPAKQFTKEGLTSSLIDSRYLISRFIRKDVFEAKEFAGTILNINNKGFNNMAFPFFNIDETIIGIEQKNYAFDYFVEGSQLTNSIWHSNIPSVLEKVVIAESAIDALSYCQLKPSNNTIYISIGGSLSYDQIKVIKALKDKSTISENFHFVSAVDNDKAGIMYNNKLKDWLAPNQLKIDLPISKDYNKDLENSLKEKKPYLKIKF